jgi:hypothetical protein
MSIKYYKTKSGKMLASLPSGELLEGIKNNYTLKFKHFFFF